MDEPKPLLRRIAGKIAFAVGVALGTITVGSILTAAFTPANEDSNVKILSETAEENPFVYAIGQTVMKAELVMGKRRTINPAPGVPEKTDDEIRALEAKARRLNIDL